MGKKEKENVNMEKEERKNYLKGENDERHKVISNKNRLGTRNTKSEKEMIERGSWKGENKQIRSSRES